MNFQNKKLYLWFTIFITVILGAIFSLTLQNQRTSNPFDNLEHPFETGIRMFERDMEMAWADDKKSSRIGKILGAREASLKETLESAIEGYEELSDYALRDNGSDLKKGKQYLLMLRARLLVLYSEIGEWKKAEKVMGQLRSSKSGQRFSDLVLFAYVKERLQPPDMDSISLLYSVSPRRLSDTWTENYLRIRLARKNQNLNEVNKIENKLFSRADPKNKKIFYLGISFMTMILSGLFVISVWLVRSRRIDSLSSGLSYPPWQFLQGYGVMARAAFWAMVLLLGFASLEKVISFDLFFLWGSLFSSLPLLYYIWRHLLKPHQLNFINAFGLKLEVPWKRLLVLTLALTFVDQAGSILIEAFLPLDDKAVNWSEYVDEVIIWGTAGHVALNMIDGALWAPVFEEIGFRGLVYMTLRRRLSPGFAILLNAGLFSLVHFYSVSGFLQIFWSGIVWSFAYEKSRSLIPGVLCHAFNNFYILMGMAILYR